MEPVDLCLVARYAARANGNCISQSFWCLETVFARMLLSILWNSSTWFVDGLYGVVRSFSMPNSRHTSFMIRPSTSLPWSLRMDNGIPNRLSTLSTKILAMGSASLLRKGKASAHLINESIHVRIHWCPWFEFGCGPVRSRYHRSNGAPARKVSEVLALLTFLGGI